MIITYDSENDIINHGEEIITKSGSTVIIYSIEDVNHGNYVEIEFTFENEIYHTLKIILSFVNININVIYAL